MSGTADRFDSGKVELDYADSFPVALQGVGKVSMAGRFKYKLFNYMRGAKSARESYNCARRHMLAWYNGEDYVPDVPAEALEAIGPIHHLDAAIWNLMRLRQELVTFADRDDRPHKCLANPGLAELTAPKPAPIGAALTGGPLDPANGTPSAGPRVYTCDRAGCTSTFGVFGPGKLCPACSND